MRRLLLLPLLLLLTVPSQAQPLRLLTATRLHADTTFVLDAADKKIEKENLHAATAVRLVAADEARERWMEVEVGAAVAANRLVLHLRGVQGQVRIRATLRPLLQQLPITPSQH